MVRQSKGQALRRGAGRPGRARGIRQWLGGGALLIAMAGAGVWGFDRLTDPQLLPLRVVHIEGELRHLRRQTLERAVAAHASGSFFSVDLEAVRRAASGLAWVEQVQVRRVWPDSLHMRVVEQQPLARWGRDSLLNLRGQVFTPEDGSVPLALPGLSGPDGSAARVSAAFRVMSKSLEPLGLEIRALHLNDRGGWQAELGAGVVLQLGTRDLDIRLARFMRLYPRLLAGAEGEPEEVDLRYTNGFTVRWRNANPQPQQASGRKSSAIGEAAVGGAQHGLRGLEQERLV
jgi:cell division protein FtsQ